jgi:hypothetical protein
MVRAVHDLVCVPSVRLRVPDGGEAPAHLLGPLVWERSSVVVAAAVMRARLSWPEAPRALRQGTKTAELSRVNAGRATRRRGAHHQR